MEVPLKFKHFQQPLILFISLLTVLSLFSVFLPTPAVAAAPVGPDKLADFEAGLPSNWFTFSGGSTVATTAIVAGDADLLARPAQSGENGLLEVNFDVFDFGGFGGEFASTAPQDWSLTEGFSFWFYGTASGLIYQAEISDNRSDPTSDTSERFDYEFTDTTPGWQRIFIPWSDFTRATDFQPAGAPDDGFTLTEIWAWAIVLPFGTDLVYFDDFGVENHIIDSFDDLPPGSLPSGTDTGSGVPIGFFTFSDGSPVAISNEASPPPSFEYGTLNSAIAVTMNVGGFAGFIHNFANDALDTWTPQDWSDYEGFAFWLYGQNSGTDLFIDLIENRNTGSTSDDAERWSVALVDDFSGWRYFEYPFDSFSRKDIGNEAPNDGFTRQEMHGWAFGSLNTNSAEYTWYLDGASLFGDAGSIPLNVTFSDGIFDIDEGTTGSVTVKLNRPMVGSDPDSVSIDYTTEPATAEAGRNYTPTSGNFTFVQGGPQEQSFSIETFDDGKFTGNLRVVLRLSNPVDVELGFIRQASALIIDQGPYDPLLLDDFERFPYLWESSPNVRLSNPELSVGDPMAIPGQGEYEGVLQATVPLLVDIAIKGRVCNQGNGIVPIILYSTPDFDATTVDHTTVSMGSATETHVDKKTGVAHRHEEDANGDGLTDLVFHFRFHESGLTCDPAVVPFNGYTYGGQPITAGGSDAIFGRDFPLGQDWSEAESLSFLYYGTGDMDRITINLKDNRAPDPGPDGWEMVWSDEFDDPAGTPPNPENWGHEIGDVTPDGKNGWGNEERQYYTDDPANAATDGEGNLVIKLREADGSLECYYGTCEYTSARLLTQHRKEFAYGRIEARLLVPDGGDGLWPAFWSLGNDIVRVPWPGAGEIDFMEYVSRLPNEIFGTIHGPGYSGGASFGDFREFAEPVFNEYHTFTVEWEPELIRWYVDGSLYHEATPADVAPNEWVFQKPFFLLLNLAIGGNFGGTIDPNLELPQSYSIDYIRVYQGPDSAERFEASFVDDVVGWRQVTIPFTDFTRSDDQPDGAPDDGLGLKEIWGYGFSLPDGTATGSFWLDQVRLIPLPPPTEITVTNLNNSGPGSLREALSDVAEGGTITFDPSLANGTIFLITGPLVPPRNVTVDSADAPGLALDGGGVDRILIIDPGVTATFANITMQNGYGFQLAGGVLNNGDLTLDHVVIANNLMTTPAGDFWQGGAGIYNGEFSSLQLLDSSVVNNNSGWAGGGVFAFFNTQVIIERSTISGNTAADVGGGMRLLGNGEIINSTISGNESTGWYGGAFFLTDGVVKMTNNTITNNISPDWAPAAVFVGTFGPGSATLNLTNTIIVDNITEGCFLAPFGAGAVAINSTGNNLFTDGTCFPVSGDLIVVSSGLDVLADNGGPTETHALIPGSPAIDTANNAGCPTTDQRGVVRPQGAACDIGAFELEP
jgi:beta-glucanase (GH16 family)